jgi:hypothetical protein
VIDGLHDAIIGNTGLDAPGRAYLARFVEGLRVWVTTLARLEARRGRVDPTCTHEGDT